MSTRSTIYMTGGERATLQGEHDLTAHIYTDMHEPKNTVVVDLGCTRCYCSYQFLMSAHLGVVLAKKLEKADKCNANQ